MFQQPRPNKKIYQQKRPKKPPKSNGGKMSSPRRGMARIYQVLEADLQFLPSRSENLENPNRPKNAIIKPEVGSIEVESWKNLEVLKLKVERTKGIYIRKCWWCILLDPISINSNCWEYHVIKNPFIYWICQTESATFTTQKKLLTAGSFGAKALFPYRCEWVTS